MSNHSLNQPAVQFAIDQTSREYDAQSRPYTAYRVVTSYQGQAFHVQRRFREFRALHDQLLPFCLGLPKHFPLWPNVFNRLEPSVIAQRQVSLVRYLTDTLVALQGNPLPPVFRNFLQLPPASEDDSKKEADPLMVAAQLEPSDTVILVAYKLPIYAQRVQPRSVGAGWKITWDVESVLNKEALHLFVRALWVGCLPLRDENGSTLIPTLDEQDELSDLLLEQFNCVPVFLEQQLNDDFYSGFCRSYLRPIFHNQLTLPNEENPFSEVQWRAYCTVNKKFSEKVMEVYEQGHLTWIHDYHLLLLPSYILRRHRTAHIGLFLHSPFPASDVFRSIAVREELLRAMLNSDLIGFLLFEYTRNFLTCCKRMLGLEHEFKRGGFLGVEYGGRHIMVQVSTFGVSPTVITRYLKETETMRIAEGELAEINKDEAAVQTDRRSPPVVLAGVDYLDRFKGVQLKLLAWEGLLEHYPKYRQGFVLVQLLITSRNQENIRGARDGNLRAELNSIVTRINTAFPGSVYLHEKSSLSMAERLCLWLKARVIVNSAIREAVNAHSLEYVLARSLANQSAGVAVLSEFSGFSRVLNGTITVNPWSKLQFVAALDQALEMPATEREARARKDLQHVHNNTSEDWARRFLLDLKSMRRKSEEHWLAVGFGLTSFRMIGMGVDFKALDTQQVLLGYRRSSHRAILLDWGGTLTEGITDMGFFDVREETQFEVPEAVLSVLRNLCANPNNHVMILSGLGRDKVQAAFGSVPNLSLAVEHGFYYRIKSGPWQQLLPGVDTSWKEVAEAIIGVYTSRTTGSFLQKKGASVTWNFQTADPEFGAMQARELQYHLQGVLAAFPVVVRVGKAYVEACPQGINKGVMADRFLEIIQASDSRKSTNNQVDFILCIGDDSSDELMFSALHSKFGQKPTDLELFTATVGRKPSDASAFLSDHHDVTELLKMLSALNASKKKQNYSMNDLTSFTSLSLGVLHTAELGRRQQRPSIEDLQPRKEASVDLITSRSSRRRSIS
eukprot:CAMPEP_0119325226 /NCGR_PEP_ID=MMETSP1333-20130426/65276_1 /TAXON_ID=418940 /ORGANISM="Scyphosphaera apsteinii, Strain RCC1455" /LENGTH=1012 /DNA_ID=CAMNT_0007333143 /DNA_START=95 /DNA_END=3133 /DNA_ORIENTATION=-